MGFTEKEVDKIIVIPDFEKLREPRLIQANNDSEQIDTDVFTKGE
jgi:hypothetical protein